MGLLTERGVMGLNNPHPRMKIPENATDGIGILSLK